MIVVAVLEAALTWEDGERVLHRRNVDPVFIIFLHASGTLLPVGIGLALVGRPDEETTNVVLRCNDKKSVVGMTADTTARFAFAIGLVSCRETTMSMSANFVLL